MLLIIVFPADAGLGGAARGLEREVASGRLRKKHIIVTSCELLVPGDSQTW
jgi:hypothetical protein